MSSLNCSICLKEIFEQHDSIALHPRKLTPELRHIFHSECIGPWLRNRNTCPLCRGNVAVINPAVQEAPAGPRQLYQAISSQNAAEVEQILNQPNMHSGEFYYAYAEHLNTASPEIITLLLHYARANLQRWREAEILRAAYTNNNHSFEYIRGLLAEGPIDDGVRGMAILRLVRSPFPNINFELLTFLVRSGNMAPDALSQLRILLRGIQNLPRYTAEDRLRLPQIFNGINNRAPVIRRRNPFITPLVVAALAILILYQLS